MKLSHFYKQVIRFGKDCDPRKDKKSIKSYPDTSILYKDTDSEINKIMVGIDIEVAELLLADRLRSKQRLDLVISHHPEGKAYALLPEVMQLQLDILSQAGLKEKDVEKFLDERKLEVERKILPQNHTRPVDAARLLNLPLMCIHTPADNHAFSFIKKLINKQKPKQLLDVIDILMNIAEYKNAAKDSVGPRILLGNPKSRVGKILVEMTGGTEGPKGIFDNLYKAGVRTLISMHLSEEHFKKAKDTNLNVIIAGHISSDTLGLNLLLDRVEHQAGEEFEVINCSGFIRIRRNERPYS